MTKYIRVVFAYEEEDEARLHAALEHLIEADTYDNHPNMGVSGAHISAPYDTREAACGHFFLNRETVDAIEGMHALALDHAYGAHPSTLSDRVTEEFVKLEEELSKYYAQVYHDTHHADGERIEDTESGHHAFDDTELYRD